MSKYVNYIIDATEIIAGHEIDNADFVLSHIGIVTYLDGYEGKVEIREDEFEVNLYKHLAGRLRVGDIVLVQELKNANFGKVIISKIAGE